MNKLTSGIAGMFAASVITITPVQADAAGGAEFQQNLVTGRTIEVDCDTLLPVGDKLAITGGFLAQYDVLGSMKGFNNLSAAQQNLVLSARTNRTTDPTLIRVMIGHVMIAHGVKQEEIAEGYNRCKSLEF